MESNQYVEMTGDTVEDAVQSGLEKLGVGPNDVMVEIIDEPSRGVFGIGARPAKVRLKLLRQPEPAPAVLNTPFDDDDEDEDEDTLYVGPASDSTADEGEAARIVVLELLEKMGLTATVEITRSEPTRPEEPSPWLLNVEGDDLDVLIGRRGETLAALQYIVRLIVSRRLQRRANIVIDVSGYKSRRSDRLEQLALRMADEAVRQERPVSLEPMPPNERRIVHMTLRDREDVYTKSTGEGDARKVTIVPK